MSQTNEQSQHRGIICKYITESPEDYETDRLAEPFASPYDPTVPRVARAPATNGFPTPPKPVQRPNSRTCLSESNTRDFHEGYLARQFAAHRPVVEQVGLIGALPGRPPTVPGNQRAYIHRQDSPIYQPPSSHPYLPTPPCDPHLPYGANPSYYNLGTPHVPTIGQLLDGVYVPTWDELDAVSKQIRELYALRALLDPHGHRLRTHVPVLPNIPSEGHRIWGGPVPLVSGNPQVEGVGDSGWNSLGNFSQTCPSASRYETQAYEAPISPLHLDEPRVPTPATVVDESIFESALEYQAALSDDSDNESVQCQSDPDEIQLNQVAEAWNNLDDIMIRVRDRSQTFVYPSKLDFVPAHGTDDKPLVNQRSFRNKAFIEYWGFLYHSLDRLNSVEPLSDRMAFALQRAVNEVNCELDNVEECAAKLWEKECQANERKRFWRNVFSSEYDDDEWF